MKAANSESCVHSAHIRKMNRVCGICNCPMPLRAAKFSIAAVFLAFVGTVNANAESSFHASSLTVYSCDGGKLVQSVIPNADKTASAPLLRSGQAVWSSGVIDATTVDAIAEGRGIWSAVPLTTLAMVAGTEIPAEILTAIAVKESGMKGRFWPWTINWNGRGFYMESRQKAIEAAKYLIGKGINNFDVSLMQVNWRWNGHRFANIESAFDPVTNVRVAGQILAEHHKATGNWHGAIARYHSRSQTLNQPYLAGVLKHLSRIQTPTLETPEKQLC